MKNITKYLHGIIIGMIGEYLYRANFDIIPLIILTLMLFLVLYDIVYNWNK